MLLEARIIRILIAVNYDYCRNFLQVIRRLNSTHFLEMVCVLSDLTFVTVEKWVNWLNKSRERKYTV